MKAVALAVCVASLALASRLAAEVAFTEPADREATLVRLRKMAQDRQWKGIVEQFGKEDFAAWPEASAGQATEALILRGRARAVLKDGKAAEADLLAATRLGPKNVPAWLALGDVYADTLGDAPKALAAYRRALALAGTSAGWQPLTATLSVARILTDQVKPDDALAVLRVYDDDPQVPPIWRIRLLRAAGHAYAAQGKERESLAKFREALDLEAKQK